MGTYRLYLRAANKIMARQDFECESDGEALVIASVLADASSDLCDSFEVWLGVRRVDSPGLRLASTHIEQAMQARLIEAEESLLASHWAVAASGRLQARHRELSVPGAPRSRSAADH